MSFHVSRTDRRNETHNSLVLKRPKLAHISLLLKSNSGAVPLSNRPYRLFVKGKGIQGTTDNDGLLEHSNIPPGDYELEIEGLDQHIVVPTVPIHIVRRPQRVPGFFLFEEKSENESEEEEALTEEETAHFPLQMGEEEDNDEDGDWEEIAVYEDEKDEDG